MFMRESVFCFNRGISGFLGSVYRASRSIKHFTVNKFKDNVRFRDILRTEQKVDFRLLS